MKYIGVIVSVCCLLGAVSCVEENFENNLSSDRITLYASIPGGVTSLYAVSKGGPRSDSGVLDYDYSGELDIAVARVDQNYVAYPDFVNCTLLAATMGTPDASSSRLRDIQFEQAQFFSGDSEISFAAWYPRTDNVVSDGSGTEVTIPIDGQTDILYSTPVSGSINRDFGVMEFNHALCLYRIYVYAMVYEDEDGDDAIADIWGALDEMKILDMPSSCTITLPRTVSTADGGNTYEGDVAYNIDNKFDIDLSDPSNNIFFDPGGELPVGQANRRHVSTFIASPPDDDIIDIELTTANTSAMQDVSIARSFEPGYAYDIVLRFSDHGIINADVMVSKWEDGMDVDYTAGASIFYDLSTYETANCYHISSANYGYCFNGKVKGNGKAGALSLNQSAFALNPAYVDILWSDMPEIEREGEMVCPVELASNSLVDGKVMFRVLGNQNDSDDKVLQSEGNVLIAAYDRVPEKDGSGQITNGAKIIWTWHLWLSDPVQTQGYSNGFVVQDRNLGAKDAVPAGDAVPSGDASNTWGMLYQWGRPTPFSPFRDGVLPSVPGTSVTMDEAVATPESMFGTSVENGAVWLADPELDGQVEHLWGYVSDWEDPQKTIYDPCPQGYRVYEERMWSDIDEYLTQKTDEYVRFSINGTGIYYPFQDTYLASSSSMHVEHGASADTENKGAFLWSGTIDVTQTPHTPYRLIFRYDDGTAIATSNDLRRNSAMPVRCVSEASEMIIRDLSASQTANCYMIHEPGYYKFNATVRGNGVGRLLPLGATQEADITDGMDVNISPVRIDFLWWQGDFMEVGYDKGDYNPDDYLDVVFLNKVPDEDGYVTFRIGEFHKGNLILAAYDADGVILWTWHIWMTDEPELKASGKYAVMDRFLGATLAPSLEYTGNQFGSDNEALATYGFYYQWGRKDPIPGPDTVSMNSETDNSSVSSSVWWSYSEDGWSQRSQVSTRGAVGISESVRAPMNFYTSATSAGYANSNWFDPSFADAFRNVALWGYAVANTQIQGESFTKTMYDPCPPGYMVPEYKVWYNDNSSNRYSEESGGDRSLSNNEWVYNLGKYNGFVTTVADFDKNWYPLAGRRDTQGNLVGVGWVGHTWTGTPMGNYNARSLYYLTRRDGDRHSGQFADAGTGELNISYNRYNEYSISGASGTAYGFPVRCMKQ